MAIEKKSLTQNTSRVALVTLEGITAVTRSSNVLGVLCTGALRATELNVAAVMAAIMMLRISISSLEGKNGFHIHCLYTGLTNDERIPLSCVAL